MLPHNNKVTNPVFFFFMVFAAVAHACVVASAGSVTCSGGTLATDTQITALPATINSCTIKGPVNVSVAELTANAGAASSLDVVINGSTFANPNYLLFNGFATIEEADAATRPLRATVTFNKFENGMIGFYYNFPYGTIIDVRYNDCNQISNETYVRPENMLTPQWHFFGTFFTSLRGGSILVENNKILVSHADHLQFFYVWEGFNATLGSTLSVSGNSINLTALPRPWGGLNGAYGFRIYDATLFSITHHSHLLYNNNTLFAYSPLRAALFFATTINFDIINHSSLEIRSNVVTAWAEKNTYGFVIDYYGAGTVRLVGSDHSKLIMSNNDMILSSAIGPVVGVSLGMCNMSDSSELALENNGFRVKDAESITVIGIHFKLDIQLSSGNFNLNSNRLVACSSSKGLAYVESGHSFLVATGGQLLFTRNVVSRESGCAAAGVPPLLAGPVVPSGTGVFYLCPWNRYGDSIVFRRSDYTAAMIESFALSTDVCFTPTVSTSPSLAITNTRSKTATSPVTATPSNVPTHTATATLTLLLTASASTTTTHSHLVTQSHSEPVTTTISHTHSKEHSLTLPPTRTTTRTSSPAVTSSPTSSTTRTTSPSTSIARTETHPVTHSTTPTATLSPVLISKSSTPTYLPDPVLLSQLLAKLPLFSTPTTDDVIRSGLSAFTNTVAAEALSRLGLSSITLTELRAEMTGVTGNANGFFKFAPNVSVWVLNRSTIGVSVAALPAYSIKTNERLVALTTLRALVGGPERTDFDMDAALVLGIFEVSVADTSMSGPAVTTTVLTAVGALLGASAEFQGLGALALLGCADPATRARFGVFRVLSPVAVIDSYAGAIIGNAVLSVVVGGTQGAAVLALRFLGRRRRLIEIMALTRFPSLMLQAVFVFQTGTAFASAQLVSSPQDYAGWEILIGVIGLIFSTVLPVFLAAHPLLRVGRAYQTYDMLPWLSARGWPTWASSLLPAGAIFSLQTRSAYGAYIAHYRSPPQQVWWTTLPAWTPLVFLVGGLFHPNTIPGCRLQFICMGLALVLLAIALLVGSPLRSPASCWLGALSRVVLAAACFSMAATVGVNHVDQKSYANATLAFSVLGGVLLIARVVNSLFCRYVDASMAREAVPLQTVWTHVIEKRTTKNKLFAAMDEGLLTVAAERDVGDDGNEEEQEEPIDEEHMDEEYMEVEDDEFQLSDEINLDSSASSSGSGGSAGRGHSEPTPTSATTPPSFAGDDDDDAARRVLSSSSSIEL